MPEIDKEQLMQLAQYHSEVLRECSAEEYLHDALTAIENEYEERIRERTNILRNERDGWARAIGGMIDHLHAAHEFQSNPGASGLPTCNCGWVKIAEPPAPREHNVSWRHLQTDELGNVCEGVMLQIDGVDTGFTAWKRGLGFTVPCDNYEILCTDLVSAIAITLAVYKRANPQAMQWL